MYTLNRLLNNKNKILKFKTKKLSLYIELKSNFLTKKITELIYLILNKYEKFFFITIKGIPFCLIPQATEHVSLKKDTLIQCIFDKTCSNCDFLFSCSGMPKDLQIAENITRKNRHLPKEVVIEITTRCNLNCKTCSTKGKRHLDVNLQTIKRIAGECISLNIGAVRLTGGEPFLHPQLEEALLFLRKKQFYILINTNATLINKRYLNTLAYTVNNVLISMQGFNNMSDNFLTNSSHDFTRKINNITKIKNIVPVVRIGTIISRTLINNFELYFTLLRKLGIKEWELYRPITARRNKEFNITKQHLITLMQTIINYKNSGINIKIANPVPFCITSHTDISLSTLLGAIADDGHSRIVWDTKGFFKPSYFINKNLGKSVLKAWNNKLIKRIRALDYLPIACKNCCHLLWCKGGSRAIAKINSGSYFKTDPMISKDSRK